MICLDTNVLARYIMGDDPKQSRQASTLIRSLTEANPGWISLAAIQELVWFLDRRIKMRRNDILTVLEGFESRSEFVIERGREFNHTLRLYRQTHADFGDCLIAALAHAAGCTKAVTFDKIAARDLGMELIGS